jgi:hypothetical protein
MCAAAGSARRTASRCASGWSASAAVRRSSRSRGRPAGASSPRRSSGPGTFAHLADPAETAAKRGSKRRAKTDRADCDLQLKLLLAGELPESWIPPAHILELRTRVRTRKTLVDQRSKHAAGHLSHEGSPVLRWALYEAGQQATRQTSPHHEYFLQVRERTDHKSASLSVARKLCRRAFHILRELGEQALAPVVDAHVEEAIHAAA